MEKIATISMQAQREDQRAIEDGVWEAIKGTPWSKNDIRVQYEEATGDVHLFAPPTPQDAQPFRKYQPNNFQPFITEGEHPRDITVPRSADPQADYAEQVKKLEDLGWRMAGPRRAWILIHHYSQGGEKPDTTGLRVYLSEDRAKVDLALVQATFAGSEWHLLETQVYG